MDKALKDLSGGIRLYYVWAYQAYHDITAKYRRTILGSFWLAGQMVVTSVSLAILFGALFHQSIQESLPYVMSGILGFGLISYIFGEGAEMFMTSGGIIKNHAYPYTYYALHTTCKNLLLFFHNVVIYWIIIALIGVPTIPHWSVLLGLPVVLIFMLTWGMLTGMLASRFRDMRFMLPYVGQLASYLTPIFWHADNLQGGLLLAINLNPLYALLQIIRDPLLGHPASALAWELSLAYTGFGVLGWLLFFSVFRRRIPFWV